jgi:biopolymer transport protein ExbB
MRQTRASSSRCLCRNSCRRGRCRRDNTPASASKVRVANSRVQQLLILMRAIAAVLLCAGLPSWVFAQAGESSVAIAALPQDLSPWGMFLQADTIVKAVMIGLAVASLVTWTVWVAKSIELFGARAAVRRGLRILAGSTTIAQAHEKLRSSKGPVAQLMQAAANEIRLSANLRGDGLKERIAWQSERIEMAAGRKISRGTGILATIGATAPFVGLFGTVWGIMDSFIGISKAHTTNLAAVAPGNGGSLNRQLFTQRQARANKRLCARPLHLPQALALKAQITRERLYRPELSSGMRRFDSSVPCRIWLETLSHLGLREL